MELIRKFEVNVNLPSKSLAFQQNSGAGTALGLAFHDRMHVNTKGDLVMDFQGRYQLLEMVSDGEARTFKARQTSSGRAVLLHQLFAERTPPRQPDLAALFFAYLRRATAEEMKLLIDMGEDAGRVFVVTQDLPIFYDLRQWLRSAAGTPEAAEKREPTQPAPRISPGSSGAATGSRVPARRPDPVSLEATQALSAPGFSKPPVPAPATAKTGQGAVDSARVSSAKDLPAPRAAGAGSPEKVNPPAVKPAPPAKPQEDAGEFTRVFFAKGLTDREDAKAPASVPHDELTASPVAPPPAAQGRDEPSEFTRVFFGKDLPLPEAHPGAPSSPEKASVPPVMTPGAVQPSQQQDVGEFTRLFQAAQTNGETRAVSPFEPQPMPGSEHQVQRLEPQAPGDFTRLFNPGAEPPRPSGPSSLPGSPRPTGPMADPSRQQAPGEVTQLLKAYQPGRSAPSPPVLQGPEPAPPSPPPLPSGEATEPGSFTQIFRQPPKPTPEPAVAHPAAPALPVPMQEPDPGEYTRMFGGASGGAPSAPAALPQAARAAGSGVPTVSTAPISLPAAPAVPTVQAPLPAPQTALPKQGKGKFLVPLIIVGGLFLLAVVVVVFFALKH